MATSYYSCRCARIYYTTAASDIILEKNFIILQQENLQRFSVMLICCVLLSSNSISIHVKPSISTSDIKLPSLDNSHTICISPWAAFPDTRAIQCRPISFQFVSLPAFSHPRYEGWPHHEQSFSIDVCLPPSLLVLSVTTQSTILCCLSMSSLVYLEYGSLGLYLVLIPSPGSPLSFPIYVHSMLVSFLSQTQV